VTGALAAIRSACPGATIDQIEDALATTGLAVQDARPGGTLTRPRIRVDLALQHVCPEFAPDLADLTINQGVAVRKSGRTGGDALYISQWTNGAPGWGRDGWEDPSGGGWGVW
jgi:hypothetical protein